MPTKLRFMTKRGLVRAHWPTSFTQLSQFIYQWNNSTNKTIDKRFTIKVKLLYNYTHSLNCFSGTFLFIRAEDTILCIGKDEKLDLFLRDWYVYVILSIVESEIESDQEEFWNIFKWVVCRPGYEIETERNVTLFIKTMKHRHREVRDKRLLMAIGREWIRGKLFVSRQITKVKQHTWKICPADTTKKSITSIIVLYKFGGSVSFLFTFNLGNAVPPFRGAGLSSHIGGGFSNVTSGPSFATIFNSFF